MTAADTTRCVPANRGRAWDCWPFSACSFPRYIRMSRPRVHCFATKNLLQRKRGEGESRSKSAVSSVVEHYLDTAIRHGGAGVVTLADDLRKALAGYRKRRFGTTIWHNAWPLPFSAGPLTGRFQIPKSPDGLFDVEIPLARGENCGNYCTFMTRDWPIRARPVSRLRDQGLTSAWAVAKTSRCASALPSSGSITR